MNITIDIIQICKPNGLPWLSGLIIFEYSDNRLEIVVEREKRNMKDTIDEFELSLTSKIVWYKNNYSIYLSGSSIRLPNKYNREIAISINKLLGYLS